jgi:hypothetical protein
LDSAFTFGYSLVLVFEQAIERTARRTTKKYRHDNHPRQSVESLISILFGHLIQNFEIRSGVKRSARSGYKGEIWGTVSNSFDLKNSRLFPEFFAMQADESGTPKHTE